MTKHEDIVDRVAETLKEPVQLDSDFTSRVMSKIEERPLSGVSASPEPSWMDWISRRRTIRISPLGGLAMAAGLSTLVLLGSRLLSSNGAETASVNDTAALQQTVVQFVFVAPEAATVNLVGDFNDWDTSSTPLLRGDGDGIWSITVPLAPGRYRYSFLVDGTTWLKDPQAATAVEDEFGRPNSVLAIGGV